MKRILILEDHESIRNLLGTMLSKNYTVVAKKDGFEGMAWLGQGNIPDLILLDMRMPRVTGFEFLSNIRTSGFFKDIPVMVVSGDDNPQNINNCFKLGIHGYMTKPFNPIKLDEKVRQILQQPQKMRSSSRN